MITETLNLINSCYPSITHDEHITDRVFVFIENNQAMLYQYRQLCQTYGVTPINRWIGRLIKKTYNLSNNGHAVATSRLIKTYTLH